MSLDSVFFILHYLGAVSMCILRSDLPIKIEFSVGTVSLTILAERAWASSKCLWHGHPWPPAGELGRVFTPQDAFRRGWKPVPHPVLMVFVNCRYNLKEFAGYAASCPTGKVSSTPGEH